MTLRRPRWLMAMTEVCAPNSAGAVQQLVEEGHEGGDAFEGEALGAEIARLNDLLEDVGAGEQVEDVPLGFSVERGRPGFEAVGDPLAALGRRGCA